MLLEAGISPDTTLQFYARDNSLIITAVEQEGDEDDD
jgi:hypothetical protein